MGKSLRQPHDQGGGDAFLSITSGAGGVDSLDWAKMLSRMYRRWAERRGFSLEIIEYTEGEEAGIKSATFNIGGEFAFGLLSAERGVHRLVRISPFDAQGRRYTTFALVSVAPIVADEMEVNEKDLKVDTYRASGAGGQHVNKTDLAVRITHLPTGIVARSNKGRDQRQNHEVAMRVLRSYLFEMEREKATVMRTHYRSYVLDPDRFIKDNVSGVETTDVESVLDGDIDLFLGG